MSKNNPSLNHSRHINGIDPFGHDSPQSKLTYIQPESVLDFGKYSGMTAKDVIEINPGYFDWLKENTLKIISPSLLKSGQVKLKEVSRKEATAKYDFYCYTDGAVEPQNPGGHMGMGALIKDATGKIELRHSEYRPPLKTNTNILAEYGALYFVMKYLYDNQLFNKKIIVMSDLKMIFHQMSGEWTVRDEGKLYQKIARMCLDMASHFDHIKFKWIPREQNTECDALSKKCLEERGIFETKRR